MNQLKQTMSPPTLRTHAAGIKYILRRDHNVCTDNWKTLADTQASIEKSSSHVPTQAKSFTDEEIERIFKLSDEGKNLVTKVACSVSMAGLTRAGSSKMIEIKDVQYNTNKARVEVIAPVQKGRAGDGKANTQEFFVTNQEHIRVIRLYLSKIPDKHKTPNSQFLKNYNEKADAYCQNMGEKSVSQLPSYAANQIGLPDPKQYKGHTWRRSAAKKIANAGASTQQLKKAGQWTSEKAMDKYIDESDLAKTKIAAVFSSVPAPQPAAATFSSNFAPPLHALALGAQVAAKLPTLALDAQAAESLQAYQPKMLWDVLVANPDHYLWTRAPQHILDRAFNIMIANQPNCQ